MPFAFTRSESSKVPQRLNHLHERRFLPSALAPQVFCLDGTAASTVPLLLLQSLCWPQGLYVPVAELR